MGINNKKDQDVVVQSGTNELWRWLFIIERADNLTLALDATAGDKQITLSPGHGVTTGEYLTISEGDDSAQFYALSVSGDVITLPIPLDRSYTAAGAVITAGEISLNKNGSVTPVTAHIKFHSPTAKKPIDISFIELVMQHPLEADDSKFGGIAALNPPIYIRKVNTRFQNLGAWSRNLNFKLFGGEVRYTDKAGAGAFSTSVEFDLRKIFGQVLRLSPEKGDYIEIVIETDLSGLIDFEVIALGSFTRGE